MATPRTGSEPAETGIARLAACPWLAGDRAAPHHQAPAHRAADAEVIHLTQPAPDRRDGSIPTPENLRPREREVLALMCRGLLLREICVELGIGLATGATHQRALFRAFGVRSALALVAKVFNTGFVKPAL
jgi:DNA-binding NarL/FixJ family response regulator